MATPPFSIAETVPQVSDLISIYPPAENTYRDVVESWLTIISDPTTGLVKPSALPAFVNSWTIRALDASSDAKLLLEDNAGVDQSYILWDHTNDRLVLNSYADDGTTPRTTLVLNGDTAVMNLTLGALQVGGNAVINVTSALATAITGTGVLNAGSITSGFGAIDVGTDPITGGAFTGTTGTFSGAVAGAAGTFSGALSGAGITSSGSNSVTATSGFFISGSPGTNVILATNGAAIVFLRPNGAGSSTGQTTISSAGNMAVAGDITASSDRRLKKSISELGSEWANMMVKDVKPVTYLRKTTEQRGIGFIAQDVQGYAPELVHEDHNGFLTLAYPNMVAILWKVVQDLQEKVAKLEAK